MAQNEQKQRALKILEESMIGTLATVDNNKPHSRYMTFFHEDFTLHTATSKKTHKTEEVKANPNAHILIGYEGEGFGDEYLEIEGKISESDDDSLKEKVWNDKLKGWFDGPNDPDLIILTIQPTHVRLMNTKGEEPQTIEV
ncbi:pyridoxamine 5'-phosphate oxidase family protein [Planococcus lenghuensis]|uniref:General stress protein n=1 Tax=Planococcus lenghuensis TaxID=2213202 RepID=A0A1Q2L1W5_9BACL|nr:pyridoxamine 5'-phosphate oxidase family protein [Planococcus lenghuensis]AQQ54406.1 general stress protein [Planococcus lenghuensis]